jgi:radical SAM superfamily enzyme YgiQ (UPF0313 family)
MNHKVLLINPAPEIPANPPLGLLYVAAALEGVDVETRVHDLGFDGERSQLTTILKEWKPDIVGITCTTPIYPHARSVAQLAKDVLPGVWVVMGGVHPSVTPESVLEDSAADAVAVGEGEELMQALVKAYPDPEAASNIPGIWSKFGGTIVQGPPPIIIKNLDSLPSPARHLVDVRKYFEASGTDRIKWSLPQPSLPMIASRGCPYRCTFCASELVHGKKIRVRSIENIRSELETLVSDHGIRGTYFYDDTLTFDVPWLEELCAMLKEMGLKWICGTRLDRVDRPILTMMKDAGCVLISYGIESGDPDMLSGVLKKGLTLDQIREGMRLTKEVGIATVANYMLGFPGETEESMKKTIALSQELDSDIAEFSVYMPLPGTELAAKAGEMGNLVEEDMSRFDYARPVYSDASLTPDLVRKYHKMAIRGFYLRPRYILRRLGRIQGWDDVKANLMGLKSFISLSKRSST